MASIVRGLLNKERQYPTSYKTGVKFFSKRRENGKPAINYYWFWQKIFAMENTYTGWETQ
jgi:hypothetical protein